MSSRLWSCFASRVPARSAVVLALAASSAAAQDTTGVGAISGAVVSAAGQPAEGVRVCALDTGACATTDARGVFRIGDLRAGRYRLEILPLEGMPFTSDEVDVRAGLDGTVEITLPTAEDFRQTVTVTAPAFQAPEAVKNSGFLVAPREILKGAAALQDVSRYVQGLPGVAIGTNDFRNDIIVRGGSPLENLFMVDNVEIPNINAFANFASAGGTVSLLDAELLQDVTFLTGGYPAPYRGMRSGTPVDLHDRVITVYGGTGEWKRRLSYSPEHKDDAYLIAVDREGVVRWLHHGAFDQAQADDLLRVLTSFADGHQTEADHDPAHRRREP